MVYKFFFTKFFLTIVLILSSCSYKEIEVNNEHIQFDKSNYSILYTDKKLEKEFTKEKEKINEKYVVVIDPGHGGKDPGAIGVNGTLEKDINLLFATIIKSVLSSSNIKVELTRTDDRYLYLRERINFAEKLKADLFISIHADASKNRNASGFSIFSLSDKASDKEAKKLAQRENKSDFIGGLKIRHSDPLIKDNLIKIFQRQTMNESSKIANIVINNIKKLSINNRGHRNAGFVVLKSLTTPSILVELGFITNKKEEKMLNNKRYLIKISKIISLSIFKYFNQRG
tara:strand:+ start:320 stop:1177 length:858 start_codon:yes stop_codon:yes gene_type:complete